MEIDKQPSQNLPHEPSVSGGEERKPTGDEVVALESDVAREIACVKRSKARWEDDFKRMKANIEFVNGLQWENQRKMRDEAGRYVCDLVLGAVKQKEATLYARNPTVEAMPRKRLRFQLWDESIEMLTDAFQRGMLSMQAAQQGAGMPDLQALAVMRDFTMGRQMEALVKRVCKTLEIVYQYQVDASTPDFKTQMKALVNRVVVCGVAYVIPNFIVESTEVPSTTEVPHTVPDRAKHAQAILNKIEKGTLSMDAAEANQLKSLMLSMGVSSLRNDSRMVERLDFDFPPATSIIPDEHCRNIVDFVAAKRVIQEFIMHVDEVNSFFGLEGDDMLKAESVSPINESDKEYRDLREPPKMPQQMKPKTAVWHVFNIEQQTDYFICEGHKKYLRPPQPLDPPIKGFWPIIALTFNNVEYEPDTKASIFPPSDVDLMYDAQKEWNRTRNALRAQRNANAPKYLVRKNVLTEDDKVVLKNAEPNEVIELENVPADKEPSQVIQVMQVARIDPAVYDTGPLEQDLTLAARIQQANVGPAQPDVTATVGTIAEQSRITVSSSNVDDLDMFLSKLASMCQQMLMQRMSETTVKRIAGPGASWPTLTRDDFINQIELTVKAASSGRPNQALRTATRERLTPLLLQAGANPIAVIEELINTMDDQLDPQKFFPIPGQALATAAPPQRSQAGPMSQVQPQQPLQEGMPDNVSPMPLNAS
jgi:hypothetical protein